MEELLLKYPLIISIPTQEDCKRYVGRVLCGNQDLDLDVTESCEFNDVYYKLNTTYGSEVDKKIALIKASSITEYIHRLLSLLQMYVGRNLNNHSCVYRTVLQEYSEFTTFHLAMKKSHISSDLSCITVTTADEGGREHNLKVSVDFNETKNIFQPQDPDLPLVAMNNFLSKYSSLSEIYSKFLIVIDQLQLFFDLMDSIDHSCCVIDPESPRRRCCHRRVWLDHNLSMVIGVDPLNVNARPDMKFLGPEHLVLAYLQKLSDKMDEWDETADFLQQILSILDLNSFPSKPATHQQILVDQDECSICFASRLNDKLPEIVCSNRSCERLYHVDCLFEWLSSINSRRNFNQLSGQCPNCEKGISCPLPQEFNI